MSLVAILLLTSGFQISAQQTPSHLRVNHLDRPLALESKSPISFSWAVHAQQRGCTQRGYRLTATLLAGEAVPGSNPNVSVTRWSSISSNVELPGLAVGPNQDWLWSISVIGPDSQISKTVTSTFSTALADWGDAQWIGRGSELNSSSDLLRSRVEVPFSVTRCRLFVASPGFVHPSLNGALVSDTVLGHKTMWHRRVLFDSHDCTALVRAGENILGFFVGGGWASQLEHAERMVKAVLLVQGEPSHSLQLTTTAARFEAAAGPVLFSDMYAGEVFDGRVASTRSNWAIAQDAPDGWGAAKLANKPPTGQLRPSLAPPVRRVQSYPARSISEPRNGIFVVDFSQNMAGWVRLYIGGNYAPGRNVTITFTEELSTDGTAALLYSNVGPATYILNGDGNTEIYEPSFTYWGFQYVQIEGLPAAPALDAVTAFFVHTALAPAGSVVFGGPAGAVLNPIVAATRASQLSNWNDLHTDCPTREKHGWLGDTQLAAETDLYTFDTLGAMSKMLGDMADTQLENNLGGLLPDVVPDGRGQGDPMQSSAYVLLVSWLLEHYNATQTTVQHYDNLVSYIAALRTFVNKSGIIPRKPLSSWGDWCPPGRGPQCPASSGMVNSFYFILMNDRLVQLADVLGRTEDAAGFQRDSLMMRVALHEAFWNGTAYNGEPSGPDSGLPRMTAMALPLYLNATPPALVPLVLDALRAEFSASGGHGMSGIVGTKYLMQVLSDYGMHDLAEQAATKVTEPSLGFWVLNQSASTLWEMWPSTKQVSIGSKNHIMFGSHGSWYFSHVVGLVPLSAGWRRARVRPHTTVGGDSSTITRVSASHETSSGAYTVSWSIGAVEEPLTCAIPTQSGFNLTFACADPNATISSIPFASYGVVVGQCGAYDTTFCHSNNSHTASVVATQCVGAHSCWVPSDSRLFGDACPAFTKVLAVQYTCTQPTPQPLFELSVKLPGADGAQIDVPMPQSLSLDEIVIREVQPVKPGDLGAVVWQHGQFVDGRAGILAGSVLNILDGRTSKPGSGGHGRYVSFDVLSGSYELIVTKP